MKHSLDNKWMRVAIEEAKKGINTAFPNPMVGAVLVGPEQELLSKGYHERPGSFHAERMALNNIESCPSGSTLYVTLEPCCSWGRTPPCTDIIKEKQISRVVIGMLDPDIRMRGKSIVQLKEYGIQVDVGIEEELCRELNFRYLNVRSENRPTVAIKVASTLDGRIFDFQKKSKWITSEKSRMHAHQLRSVYDGILIGSGTLLSDNPSLNCRIEGGRNPTPIVLDSQLCCPLDAKILTAGKKPILCMSEHVQPRTDLPVEYLKCGYSEKGLDIRSVLEQLYQRGVYTVLVEGGSKVVQSFIDAGCVDILELYLGNVFLGGGGSWGEGINFSLENAPRLSLRSTEPLGPDIHLSYFWES